MQIQLTNDIAMLRCPVIFYINGCNEQMIEDNLSEEDLMPLFECIQKVVNPSKIIVGYHNVSDSIEISETDILNNVFYIGIYNKIELQPNLNKKLYMKDVVITNKKRLENKYSICYDMFRYPTFNIYGILKARTNNVICAIADNFISVIDFPHYRNKNASLDIINEIIIFLEELRERYSYKAYSTTFELPDEYKLESFETTIDLDVIKKECETHILNQLKDIQNNNSNTSNFIIKEFNALARLSSDFKINITTKEGNIIKLTLILKDKHIKYLEDGKEIIVGYIDSITFDNIYSTTEPTHRSFKGYLLTYYDEEDIPIVFRLLNLTNDYDLQENYPERTEVITNKNIQSIEDVEKYIYSELLNPVRIMMFIKAMCSEETLSKINDIVNQIEVNNIKRVETVYKTEIDLTDSITIDPTETIINENETGDTPEEDIEYNYDEYEDELETEAPPVRRREEPVNIWQNEDIPPENVFEA